MHPVGSEGGVIVKEWCFGFWCESCFLNGDYIWIFGVYVVFELVGVSFDAVDVYLDYFEV